MGFSCEVRVSKSTLQEYEDVIGYTFSDISLLQTALTHSSVARTRADSNERMEFLGDVVLGLVICEKLYRDHPTFLEGQLTKVKSAVVSRHVCAQVAHEIGLVDMLVLGKGFARDALPQSLAAAVLECVIGAVYLDGGLAPAREFIVENMTCKIDEVIADQHHRNYKSILQQYLQKRWDTTPTYELLDEKGPDHAKAFEVCVQCNGQRFGSAWANNKKMAEQLAAQTALTELGLLEEKPGDQKVD